MKSEDTIFRAAIEILDRKERTAFLIEECDKDDQLIKRVNIRIQDWENLKKSVFEQLDTSLEIPAGLHIASEFESEDFWRKVLSPENDSNHLGVLKQRYEILEILGSGGSGCVFLANDIELKRKVAVKIINPLLCENEIVRQRFRSEAAAIASVHSENIVQIFDVEFGATPSFLVMEYVEGESLETVMLTGRLKIIDIIRIGVDVTKALVALHDASILHRDIKPQNLLVEFNSERVKVIDFGLAIAEEQTRLTNGVPVGTLRYMSPEHINGDELSASSDLYSLGRVLRVLSNSSFQNNADESRATSTGSTNAIIPEWLEQTIDKLLQEKPAARIQSAKELLLILEKGIAHMESPFNCSAPTIMAESGESEFRTWSLGPWIAYIAIISLASAFVYQSLNVAGAKTAPLAALIAGMLSFASGLYIWAPAKRELLAHDEREQQIYILVSLGVTNFVAMLVYAFPAVLEYMREFKLGKFLRGFFGG